MRSSENLVEVEGAAVKLGGQEVLREVNYSVRPGTISGLVGANGAGKSVLLRLLCGLLRPSSGSVLISPELLPPGRSYPLNFGISIDGPAFLSYTSGLRNLSDLAAVQGKISVKQVRGWMVDIGLDPDLRTPVSKYSTGMKQKLSLVQAMMEDPTVLLLDEPFNGLDRESSEWLYGRLRLLRDQGKAIVFTSHRDKDINELSSRVHLLESGVLRDA